MASLAAPLCQTVWGSVPNAAQSSGGRGGRRGVGDVGAAGRQQGQPMGLNYANAARLDVGTLRCLAASAAGWALLPCLRRAPTGGAWQSPGVAGGRGVGGGFGAGGAAARLSAGNGSLPGRLLCMCVDSDCFPATASSLSLCRASHHRVWPMLQLLPPSLPGVRGGGTRLLLHACQGSEVGGGDGQTEEESGWEEEVGHRGSQGQSPLEERSVQGPPVLLLSEGVTSSPMATRTITTSRLDESLSSSSSSASKENLRRAESDFLTFTGYLAKYMTVMLASGAALEAYAEVTGGGASRGSVLSFCWMAGVVLGHMVGAARVLDTHAGMRMRTGVQRGAVVTGSTRGLGKALARELLLLGDSVVVTSRSESAVVACVRELQLNLAAAGKVPPPAVLWLSSNAVAAGAGGEEVVQDNEEQPGDAQENGLKAGLRRVVLLPQPLLQTIEQWRPPPPPPPLQQQQQQQQVIVGISCDVRSAKDVRRLADTAAMELGTVDLWINNAGTNTEAKPFVDFGAEELEQVVATNLLGSLLCTREAMRLMARQARDSGRSSGGHIFNMDGAGSQGGSTPRYAAYGASKCGLRQLHATLLKESRGARVGIHTASPGMVLTDLLLSGATVANKQAFNIICEQPETVARALVPRMRAVRGTGRAVNYLTPPRILLALVSAWVRRGRWFDDEGRAVYATEADRLRAWAQGQRDSRPLDGILDIIPTTAWVSLLSSSAIGVYLFFSSLSVPRG